MQSCNNEDVPSLLSKLSFENAKVSEFEFSLVKPALSLKVENASWMNLSLPPMRLELSEWKRMEWQRLVSADAEYGETLAEEFYEPLEDVMVRYGQFNMLHIKGKGTLSNAWNELKFEHIKKLELLFDQDNASKLSRAVIQGELPHIEELLNNGVDANIPTFHCAGHYIETNYSLIQAVEQGSLEIVRLLIEKGADVNVSTQGDGQTALHTAFFIDSIFPQKLSDAERKTQIYEMVKYLVKHGADVNAKGGFCLAPLHQAVYRGHFELVKYLIQNGADVNLVVEDVDENESRATCLGCAVQESNLEIIKLLIEHGANPFLSNNGWITPMEEALEMENKEIINLLKE